MRGGDGHRVAITASRSRESSSIEEHLGFRIKFGGPDQGGRLRGSLPDSQRCHRGRWTLVEAEVGTEGGAEVGAIVGGVGERVDAQAHQADEQVQRELQAGGESERKLP